MTLLAETLLVAPVQSDLLVFSNDVTCIAVKLLHMVIVTCMAVLLVESLFTLYIGDHK